MRACDLPEATRLTAEIDLLRAILRRMDAGEPLSVTLGTGPAASGIVLAPAYMAELRADIAGALRARLAEKTAARAALVVDP